MSQEFTLLADKLEKKIMLVYREVKDVRDASVVSFRYDSLRMLIHVSKSILYASYVKAINIGKGML